ncbi:MAG TPA: class I SAM-dependent methyltransferase [Gammaproteobacteria bacterium]
MQAFSAAWLALREPADARARSAALVEVIRGSGAIVDLGAGTGANLRYLAPRLGGNQEWLLVDSDGGLLSGARAQLREWAATLDARVETDTNRILITAASFSAAVRTQELDIARNLAALPLSRGCLVTASALLDLVSPHWLEALADACRAANAEVLFALTYDGRMTLEPAEPDDEIARALFNRHQRKDKGFGPALGPEAAAAAKPAFAKRGYVVETAASDWRLGHDEQRLQGELIDGWLDAALEIDPDSRHALEPWHARHRRRIDAGQCRMSVGHADVAGRPSR